MTTVIVCELDEPWGSLPSQETIAQTDNEQARLLMRNKMMMEVVVQVQDKHLDWSHRKKASFARQDKQVSSSQSFKT